MAQSLMYGMTIEAHLPNGQLSLHDYRKFLSQSNDIITMAAEPSRRTLKRKPATINLNQVKLLKQPPPHDFASNLYSPVSSAPSSPPPLSFCQSVVTLHGDLPTPVSPSPLPSSTIRSFSRPSSVSRSSASQRIESFSSRLKQAKNESAMSYAHHRASSDSILLGLENSHATVTHNGASFQILNPHKSLESSRIVPPASSVRSSAQSGLAEMNQENPDQNSTMAREQAREQWLLGGMVRPISASESAILSRAPIKPAAPIPTESDAGPSFVALPSIQDEPVFSRPGTPWPSEKTPTRTLRQKVSRFFGSAEKKSDRGSQNSGKSGSSNVSTLHADSHQPSIATRKSIDGESGDDEGHSTEDVPISLSLDVPQYLFDEGDFLDFSGENRVSGHGASMSEPSMSGSLRRVSSLNSEMSDFDLAANQHDQAVEQHEQGESLPAALNDEEQSDSNAVETRPWRRPVYGPHFSNRHQTLHDALSQLNTNRQSGATYEDITEYLRSQAGEVGYVSQSHERVEKPWQPETWPEPRTFASPLCSRASDGELSTTAPSTRPSIRPFARQAAAFIAVDGLDSTSVTSVGTAIDDVGEDDEAEKRVEYAMEEQMEAAQPSPNRKSTMRRAISQRARPLSSNPPELDIPIFLAASRSSSSSSLSPSCRNVQIPKADDAATGDGGNIMTSDGSSTSSANNASPSAEALASATRAPAPAPTVSLSPRPLMTAGTGVSCRLGVPEDSVHGTAGLSSKTMSLRGSTASTGARGSGGKMKKATKRHQQKPKRASGCCCS